VVLVCDVFSWDDFVLGNIRDNQTKKYKKERKGGIMARKVLNKKKKAKEKTLPRKAIEQARKQRPKELAEDFRRTI